MIIKIPELDTSFQYDCGEIMTEDKLLKIKDITLKLLAAVNDLSPDNPIREQLDTKIHALINALESPTND